MATATGLDTVHIGNGVAIHRDVYWGNGFDPCKVWDGLGDIRNLGIASYDATPSVSNTGSGSVTIGDHLVRVRYMRGAAEYPGDASPGSTITAPGSQQVRVAVVATTAEGVDTIVVEMTAAGGSTYYEAARVNNADQNVDINATDTQLAAYLSATDAYGHYAPRPGSVLAEHKGCLCVGVPALHTQGTVQVSGTYVNGASTNWKAVVGDDWWFTASGDTTAYRVDTYNSGTSIELADTHGAVATGATYKLWSPHQNKIEVSKPLYPESFGDNDGARRQQEVLQGKSDVLRSFVTWNGYIVVLGEHSMEKWTWTSDAMVDAGIYQVPGERGTINARTVRNIEGVLYSWDKLGMYTWAGGQPQNISRPIDQMLDNIAWDYSDRFHSVFYPEKRLMMWFAATGTQTEPRTAFVYHIDNGAWHTRAYDYGWTAVTLAPDSLGIHRPFFFDENGFSWFSGIGYRDGAHPTTTVAMTVATGSTTDTVTISSGDTLYLNGGSGMAGVPVYWSEGEETFYATSNEASSNTIYPAASLSSAPSAGDTMYAGITNFRMRTKAFNIVGTDNEQLNVYLGIDFLPTPTSQYLKVRVYENFSPSGRTDWGTVTDGQEGVSFTAGSEDIVVDLSTVSGNVKIPLSDVWNEYVEFEFEVDTPDVRMMLLGYYLITEGEREQKL